MPGTLPIVRFVRSGAEFAVLCDVNARAFALGHHFVLFGLVLELLDVSLALLQTNNGASPLDFQDSC